MKAYVDTSASSRVAKAGDTIVGALAMSRYKITGLFDPALAQDTATRNYVDSLGAPKFTIVTGTLPNTTYADVTIYMLPTGKSIANRKIWIAGLWVEQEAGTWISSYCALFAAQFTSIEIFTRGPSILMYVYTIPASGWMRDFKLHVIHWNFPSLLIK